MLRQLWQFSQSLLAVRSEKLICEGMKATVVGHMSRGKTCSMPSPAETRLPTLLTCGVRSHPCFQSPLYPMRIKDQVRYQCRSFHFNNSSPVKTNEILFGYLFKTEQSAARVCGGNCMLRSWIFQRLQAAGRSSVRCGGYSVCQPLSVPFT